MSITYYSSNKMIGSKDAKPHTSNDGHFLTRRSFFRNSGGAILATTLLSSCNDLIDDIFGKDSPKDKTLAFFGDSLTIGIGGTAPYGNLVAAAMQDRPVLSDGIVGQSASSIAVRQGGVPLKISVEGGKLNGIMPVKLTKMSNAFLSTFSNNNEYSRIGTVNGIRCTITRTGSIERGDMYTITPGSVSVADIPAESVFILEDADRLKTATQILWYGRNNIAKWTTGTDVEIMTSLENSIDHITAPARYLVLGVLLGVGEGKGTERFNQVAVVNEKLAAKYGERFVEMTPPTEAEMTAIDYTATSGDLLDIANLNFPRGMRADFVTDDIHLNDKGYKIVANRVIRKLKALRY